MGGVGWLHPSPLAGAHVTTRPYFVAHLGPAALFVATLAVWIAVELPHALRRRPEATPADRGSLRLLRLCYVVAVVAAALAAGRVPGASSHDAALGFAIGLALTWCGIALRWWAMRTLGRYFTFTVMTSADQPVITTGPYRFVRHPSYVGGLLALTGIGCMYGNWLSLAALAVIPVAGFIIRIHVEEAALSATLGSAYLSYAAGRKRLIPFVW